MTQDFRNLLVPYLNVDDAITELTSHIVATAFIGLLANRVLTAIAFCVASYGLDPLR